MMSIGTYAVFIGASALIDVGIPDIGNWFLLVIFSGIVCMITTGISLARWTQCDISNGRFLSHPGRSALVRVAPGLVMMCASALPLDAISGLLFISGFNYSALFLIVELICSVSVRSQGLLPPPVSVVSLTWIVTLYAPLFGFMFLVVNPDRRTYTGVAIILLALGGFALAILWQGSRKGSTPAHPPTKYFYRCLLPRERLTLIVCAGLDILVAAFALWAAL